MLVCVYSNQSKMAAAMLRCAGGNAVCVVRCVYCCFSNANKGGILEAETSSNRAMLRLSCFYSCALNGSIYGIVEIDGSLQLQIFLRCDYGQKMYIVHSPTQSESLQPVKPATPAHCQRRTAAAVPCCCHTTRF